jgi:hypothetical protein
LVQTGRMTGQAPIHAQEYQQQCIERGETQSSSGIGTRC